MSELNKKNKEFLINYIKQNLNIDTIASRDEITNPIYVFKYKNYPPLFIKYMMDWVTKNYTYTIEEFNDAITSDETYNTTLFKRLDNRDNLLPAYVYCINKLLDNISVEYFTFTYNQTNYKPCHNILVETLFENKEQPWHERFNIQIRKDDFPFNEGDCYGRNTQAIKSFILTDDNFDKYCDKIGIKRKKIKY